MQIIQGTTDFEINGKSAVSIGKFDGIHLGHQKLLHHIIKQKEQGLKAVVFTFDPPPSVFFGTADTKELMTKEEKRAAFENMGVDVLIEFPLTAKTAAISPESFIIDILMHQIHADYIAAGTDVSFGDKGLGNYLVLQSMSKNLGYELQIIDKVCLHNREVSSTYVREEVERGNMENVTKLLGMPYSVCGEVLHGNAFGRTIGMPTVNLLLPENKLLPPNGVYYSEVYLGNKKYFGITNIGYKPTVSDKNQMGVETYIYDFNKEVYGEKIIVHLLSFKRSEIKFNGKDNLKKQIMADMKDGYIYHNLAIIRE